MDFDLTYHRYSERSILVQWPQKIDPKILDDVLIFKNHLELSSIEQLLQINHSYNSILIIYDITIDNIYDAFSTLKSHYSGRNQKMIKRQNLWKIPVCYDAKFGIDLEEISVKNGRSKSEIIDVHCSTIYTVYFIGFLPGFLYLGGLDKRLHFPRKKEPRLRVEKGAVGIGNEQTGIYPNSSPAGWNIIGNSPLEFFNATACEPCFAKANDKIQFVPVSLDEYIDIKKAVQQGDYNIKNKILHD